MWEAKSKKGAGGGGREPKDRLEPRPKPWILDPEPPGPRAKAGREAREQLELAGDDGHVEGVRGACRGLQGACWGAAGGLCPLFMHNP